MTGPVARSGFPYRRILSAIGAILGFGLVVWAGLPLLAPVWLVLTFVAVHEYSLLLENRSIPIRRRSIWFFSVLMLIAALPPDMLAGLGLPAVVGPGLSWRELVIVLFAVYLVCLELIKPNQNSLNCVVFSLFGFLYIPVLFSYVLSLRYLPNAELGLWYLAFAMLAIVGSDVGAYVFGSLLGRRKLAPLISPNKTVEGAIGGLVLGTAVVAAAYWAVRSLVGAEALLGNVWLFGLVVAAAGQAGDLFESMLKRWAGVKDTGNFLPGHGGVLDRIDSQLFACAFCFVFLSLFVY